jgi:NAD(P) transhydrogenase subunit alpha
LQDIKRLLAADMFPRYFDVYYCSRSIPPAKMLILGAGVAGSQAIATAKRLGAVVEVLIQDRKSKKK